MQTASPPYSVEHGSAGTSFSLRSRRMRWQRVYEPATSHGQRSSVMLMTGGSGATRTSCSSGKMLEPNTEASALLRCETEMNSSPSPALCSDTPSKTTTPSSATASTGRREVGERSSDEMISI